jgi:hypothetical protein
MSGIMQVRPVGGELCDVDRGTDRQWGDVDRETDRQLCDVERGTDMTELIVNLTYFANVPKNSVRTSQKTQ